MAVADEDDRRDEDVGDSPLVGRPQHFGRFAISSPLRKYAIFAIGLFFRPSIRPPSVQHYANLINGIDQAELRMRMMMMMLWFRDGVPPPPLMMNTKSEEWRRHYTQEVEVPERNLDDGLFIFSQQVN